MLQEFIKEPQSLMAVRFQDCDPFGHLNNARYLDYFFNARQDHLVQFYDFHIYEWGKAHNESWVVTQNQIAYLYPVLVMEEVLIKTSLIHLADKTILIEGVMLDKAQPRIKALLWTEFTYVSLATGKPKVQPDELQGFFQSILLENSFWAQGFIPRTQQLKQQYQASRREPQQT